MDAVWKKRIWELMEEAFPPSELRVYEDQCRIMERPEIGARTLTEGGCLTGFILWWDLPSCRFIEYLAVAEGLRGAGRGKRLLSLALEGAAGPVVLEIEPPEDSKQALERLHFYRKNGFLINDFPYLQQPLKKGDEPIPLRIMSCRKGMTEQEFAPLKEEIYRAVYGVTAKADP